MDYEGQICRTPMERSAFMLPVVVGCSYNACKFCGLFKHLHYREIPLEKIKEEIERVCAVGGHPKKVFLGDGSAFSLSTDRLAEIAGLIHDAFSPDVTINCDATVSSILARSDEELARLAQSGFDTLYIGIESGLDDVLLHMRKDHGVDEARSAIDRLQRAGLRYSAHYMTGVAGSGRGRENALALADFFNETQPASIVNFSMFIHEECPLGREVDQGVFAAATELENLEEDRLLVERVTCSCSYESFHDYLRFHVRGKLPDDKERILKRIDERIEAQRLLDDAWAFVSSEYVFEPVEIHS